MIRERDREELEGEHDQYEYMQPFHWPGKSVKKKYKMKNCSGTPIRRAERQL